MNMIWNLVAIVITSFVSLQIVLASPFPDEEAENLKYTFGATEEIPAGFFDEAPPEKRSPKPVRTERIALAACQDGSGGMCVPAGQCAQDLKAEPIQNRAACDTGKECCYGPPLNSQTLCAHRGGECTAPPRSCGNGPQLRSGTECDHANGEICCIWTL